jgi:DNA-binding response OmpR family regulator
MDQDVALRRALIVEDEYLIAFDVEASMRELGFDICTVASNERDAIELAKSDPPDVVVMDVYLNGTRAGIETARWLREVCGVPVVFMTAQIDKSTLDRIRTVMPGAPVLSKPVYRETLAKAVSSATH